MAEGKGIVAVVIQSDKATYHYLTDEAPRKYDIVFLGIDLGSNDVTVYWKYDGEVFHPITKEEYERLNKDVKSP